MSVHAVATTAVSFGAAAVASAVTVVVLAASRAETRVSAWSIAALTGVSAVWAVTLGMRTLAATSATAELWLRLGWVAAAVPATAGVVFVFDRTGTVRLTRSRLVALAVEPVVVAAVAATNPAHGLYATVTATRMGASTLLIARPGVGYLAHGGYSVALGVVMAGLLVRDATSGPAPYRRQAALMVGATALPTAAAAGYLSGVPVAPAFDTTPMWLGVSAVILLVAAREYGLLGATPVAHETVFREVDDPTLVIDDDNRLLAANPAAREAFDVSSEVIGRDVRAVGDAVARVVAGGERTTVTVERTEYEATVSTARDGGVRVWTFRDVTRRRRVERRFRTYVEQAEDVLVVVDGDGEVEYVSDAVRRTLGHEPDRLVGRSVLGMIHPDDRERATDVFRGAVSAHDPATDGGARERDDAGGVADLGGDRPDAADEATDPTTAENERDGRADAGRAGAEHATGREWTGESTVGRTTDREEDDENRGRFRVTHGDGGWRTVEAIAAVGRDTGGERLLVNLRDVTDRQRYEQRLRVLNRVLRHDLRNDANVVLGYADLLLAADLSDEARDRARAIRRKATRLVELGEQARAVDRTLHATGGESRPVRLDRVIRAVTDRARESYADCQIDADCPDEVRVRANDLLASAISELVGNGIEHNDSTEPWVRVSVTVGDQWVYVTVTDDGPGIPESERTVLDHGTETALEHGSGLGLWLVNWIVDAVDGDVSFAERTPRGSEVTLRLIPASEPSADSSSADERKSADEMESTDETD